MNFQPLQLLIKCFRIIQIQFFPVSSIYIIFKYVESGIICNNLPRFSLHTRCLSALTNEIIPISFYNLLSRYHWNHVVLNIFSTAIELSGMSSTANNTVMVNCYIRHYNYIPAYMSTIFYFYSPKNISVLANAFFLNAHIPPSCVTNFTPDEISKFN